MAIDLCNKTKLMQAALNLPAWESYNDEDVDDCHSPLGALEPEQRAGLEIGYQSSLCKVDPRYVVGDPAAWVSDFGYAVDLVAQRMDPRPNDLLARVALEDPDPAMREQAAYEYADRNPTDACELLCEVARRDPNREVRWDALWAIEKLGGLRALQALRKFRRDADPEIAEWSRLFISELQTGDPAFDERPCRSTPGRTFDETIYLLIHCDLYIRLDATNQRWAKLSLSPQALARVYGQGHACPNVATREHQLIIAKTTAGMHADGSPHIDNYLFRGFTERTRPDRGNFYFESQVRRPFYLSGRADDESMGVRESQIGFMRQGCWYLDNRYKIRGADAIRYVRGRFQGWGELNREGLQGKALDQILVPGNAILSTLHDPVAGRLTNVFISGTFKGKLSDWDEDGYVDLNSCNVYSTVDGELDSDMDGIPDEPGVSCCNHPSPYLGL